MTVAQIPRLMTFRPAPLQRISEAVHCRYIESSAIRQSPHRQPGVNPHQKPAQAFVTHGTLPFKGMFIEAGIVIFLISICSSVWIARLHQLIGRIELIRAGL